MKKTVSPSRTYVAMCNNTNFDGHYFKKFRLPDGYAREYFIETMGIQKEYVPLANNNYEATWYFLNHINNIACLDRVITWEDYNKIEDEDVSENKLTDEKSTDRMRLLKYQEEMMKQWSDQVVESMLQYVERKHHEPGCDGNFNGGVSCSCSPHED